jgi:hypothetical protein
MMEQCAEHVEIRTTVAKIALMSERMADTHANTVQIIQALYGAVGTLDTGLLGQVQRLSLLLDRVTDRVTQLECGGRAAARTWADRAIQFGVALLPLVAVLVWYALIGWHSGVTP